MMSRYKMLIFCKFQKTMNIFSHIHCWAARSHRSI